jgi:hypothetical protein
MDQAGNLDPLLNCNYQHVERRSMKDESGKSRLACTPTEGFGGWYLD